MDKRPTGLCQNPLITGVMCVGFLLAAIGCDAGGASNAKPRFAPPNAAQDGSQEALNMNEMVRNGKLLASGQKLSDFRLKLFLDKAAPGDIREVLASNNLLTSTGVKTIMSAASTSSMTTLYLNNNAVGNEGLAAVASSPRLANLQWLQLSAVKADSEGVKSLASAEHVPAGLKGLTLSYNAVSDAGAQALATMKWPGSVELVQCKIGGQGARELIQKTSWGALNLSDNPIGPGGLDGLSGVSASLGQIMLDKCKLGDGGVKALAAAPAPALRVLSLRYNGLTDAGIDALIAAPWLPTLKTLTLTAHGASSKARQRLIDAWGQRPGLNVAAP